MNRINRLLGLLIAISVVSLVLDGRSFELHQFTITTLINIITVVGLYIFVGNSGLLSFGHVSFMVIGAYLTALLVIPVGTKHLFLPNLPGILATSHLTPMVALLIGAVLSGVFAAVVGLPLMRLRGVAASIGTLALIVIVQVVMSQWKDVTGGNKTLGGIPFYTTLTNTLIITLLAILVAAAFDTSRAARRLRAAREDEHAAAAVGVRVIPNRLIAFALSATVMAAAGALYAGFLGTLSVDTFYLQTTFLALAMLIVGGMGNLMGAVAGAVFVSVVTEVFGRLQSHEPVGPLHVDLPDGSTNIALALIVLLVLVVRPQGLLPGRQAGSPQKGRRTWRRRTQPSPIGDAAPADA